MKTIFNTLLAILVLITISGCDKKEAALPENKHKCKLISSTMKGSNMSIAVGESYEYDTQGRLSKTNVPYAGLVMEFIYDNKNRLIEQLHTTQYNKARILSTYDASDNLIQQDLQRYNDGVWTTYITNVHLYNKGQRIETQVYAFGSNVLEDTYVYKYNAGRLLGYERFIGSKNYSSNKVADILFDFDDKSTPLQYIPIQNLYNNGLNPEVLLTKHNITTYQTISKNIYHYLTYTATYTYNEHGYPTEAVKTYVNGVDTIVYNYTYTYDCGE